MRYPPLINAAAPMRVLVKLKVTSARPGRSPPASATMGSQTTEMMVAANDISVSSARMRIGDRV